MLLNVQNLVKEYRLPGQKPIRVLDGEIGRASCRERV